MAAGVGLVALAYAGLRLTAATGDFWGRVVPLMLVAGVGLGVAVAPLVAALAAALTLTTGPRIR